MSRMRRILALSATAAMLTMTPALAPAATAGPVSPTVTSAAKGCERQLAAAVETHLDAITDRDLDAYASTLHDEVSLIFPDGSMIQGKDAVVDLHEQLFADTSWRQDFLDVDTTTVGCQTGWTRVEYNYIGFNPDGTEAGRSHALFTLTWTRERGQWLVLADQNTRIS